jgi:hypothetical protein
VVIQTRKLSIFDKLMKDPKVQEKAAAMMQDPAAMSQAMETLTSSLKDGGGGMAGMLLRNSPIKGVVDKMGGIENIERMLKDPMVQQALKNMMNDPAAMAKATANMEAVMKKEEEAQLPGKK